MASVIECSGWVVATGETQLIVVVLFAAVADGDVDPDSCVVLVVATKAFGVSVMAAGCCCWGLEVSRCSTAFGLGPNSPSGRTRYCWTPIT